MKLTKEELLQKISEKVIDEDLSIELMEDISDSFETMDNSEEIATLKATIESKDSEIADLKAKYKARFLGCSDSEDNNDSNEGLEEKEVIDIREI